MSESQDRLPGDRGWWLPTIGRYSLQFREFILRKSYLQDLRSCAGADASLLGGSSLLLVQLALEVGNCLFRVHGCHHQTVLQSNTVGSSIGVGSRLKRSRSPRSAPRHGDEPGAVPIDKLPQGAIPDARRLLSTALIDRVLRPRTWAWSPTGFGRDCRRHLFVNSVVSTVLRPVVFANVGVTSRCQLLGCAACAPGAVGIAAGFDDVAAEGEAVNDGGAESWIGECLGPAAEGLVACNCDGGLLFAFGENLEQQFGATFVQSYVTEFLSQESNV